MACTELSRSSRRLLPRPALAQSAVGGILNRIRSARPAIPAMTTDAEVARWVAEVRTQGFVIIPGFLSPDEVEAQKAAMAEVTVLQGGVGGNGHMDHTIRAHNLIGKTRACDPIVEDPRMLALVEGVLGPEIQVSVTTLMDMLPGERQQNYHQCVPHQPPVCL